MTTMRRKMRSWIGGLLGAAVLMAVGWGVGAQEPSPSRWGIFSKLECPGNCPPLPHGPGVECCVKEPLDPIIVHAPR